MNDRAGQVRSIIRQLNAVNLELLSQRMLAAITRDDTGTVTRDGYPTGSVGSGGEDAPQSSTEAAALANLAGPSRDVVHEHVTAAADRLWEAAAALDAARRRLDLLDQLAGPPITYDPSGSCAVCGRHVEGTAADRLRRGLCDADYRAWVRAGRPELVEFKRSRTAA